MRMIVAILFCFSTSAMAIAPTSEFGLGVEQSAFRQLSSNNWDSQNHSTDDLEFLRVEDDLGLVFRMGKINEMPIEWKVFATGMPIVSTKAKNSCERKFASAMQTRLQQILSRSDNIELEELQKYNHSNGLKAWVYADNIQLNQLLNLKLLNQCWQKRKVSSQD